MRDTPEGIVEELRETAMIDAVEVGVPRTEMTAWEAAELIVYLQAHLGRIAAGEADAAEIARQALDPARWMMLP